MRTHQHSSHSAIVKRLNRAAGHLRSTVTMIEDGRTCVDIAQQLDAVEKAVASAKRALIHDHIDHCLNQTTDPGGGAAAMEEFRAISRYL